MQMKTKFTLIASVILVSICTYGCGGNNSVKETTATNETVASDSTKLPVETNKPNTGYKPAFEGQTRIAGVKTTTPYKVEKIAEKLVPVLDRKSVV